MCRTNVISHHIGHLGRRSYDRRMRMASPLFVEKRGEMTRLLNEVDKLSEQLHDEFATITEEDYRMFGTELKLLISTLKDLRRDNHLRADLRLYDDRMRQQIVDLEELDHDIYEFRVKAPKNKSLQETLAKASKLDFSKLPF